jgi:hypothetical protein
MRKNRPPKKQPESVTFDRSPGKQKLELDLDTAISTASEHGLSSADIIELLLLRAEQTAVLARERGEDLSRLAYLVEEEEAVS